MMRSGHSAFTRAAVVARLSWSTLARSVAVIPLVSGNGGFGALGCDRHFRDGKWRGQNVAIDGNLAGDEWHHGDDAVRAKRVERARFEQHVRWHIARIEVIEPGESSGAEHWGRVFGRNGGKIFSAEFSQARSTTRARGNSALRR